jgi:hypothetical protein
MTRDQRQTLQHNPNDRAVEHLDEMGGFAGLGQKLEERLEDTGLAEAPEPLPDAVPRPESRRKRPQVRLWTVKKCSASMNLRSFRPGWPRRDWAAAKTCNVIAQSSSVIPVSITGVPCCRFAMNRRIADSKTPHFTLSRIRPHGLDKNINDITTCHHIRGDDIPAKIVESSDPTNLSP